MAQSISLSANITSYNFETWNTLTAPINASFNTHFPYTAIFLHNVWLVTRVYRYNSHWSTSFQSFETCLIYSAHTVANNVFQNAPIFGTQLIRSFRSSPNSCCVIHVPLATIVVRGGGMCSVYKLIRKTEFKRRNTVLWHLVTRLILEALTVL